MKIKRNLQRVMFALFMLPFVLILVWSYYAPPILSGVALSLLLGLCLYAVLVYVFCDMPFRELDKLIVRDESKRQILSQMLVSSCDTTREFIFEQVVNVTRRNPDNHHNLFSEQTQTMLQELIDYIKQKREIEWERGKVVITSVSGEKLSRLGATLTELDRLIETIESLLMSRASTRNIMTTLSP